MRPEHLLCKCRLALSGEDARKVCAWDGVGEADARERRGGSSEEGALEVGVDGADWQGAGGRGRDGGELSLGGGVGDDVLQRELRRSIRVMHEQEGEIKTHLLLRDGVRLQSVERLPRLLLLTPELLFGRARERPRTRLDPTLPGLVFCPFGLDDLGILGRTSAARCTAWVDAVEEGEVRRPCALRGRVPAMLLTRAYVARECGAKLDRAVSRGLEERGGDERDVGRRGGEWVRGLLEDSCRSQKKRMTVSGRLGEERRGEERSNTPLPCSTLPHSPRRAPRVPPQTSPMSPPPPPRAPARERRRA